MARKKEEEIQDPEAALEESLKGRHTMTGVSLKDIQAKRRVWSTKSLGLDLATGRIDPIYGNGGFPAKSIVEIFGPTGAYKTGTLENIIKSIQEDDPKNRVVVLYSEEPNAERMERMGIDLDRVIMLGVPNAGMRDTDKVAEEDLMTMCQLAKNPLVKLCAIDSIPAMPVYEEMFDTKGKDREFADADKVAAKANVLARFIKRFKFVNNCSVLLMINQYRVPIEIGFSKKPRLGEDIRPETPGGRIKEFESDIRIFLASKKIEDDSAHDVFVAPPVIGLEVHYKLVKNRFMKFISQKKAISKFIFTTQKFDRAAEIVSYATYLDLITVGAGGRFQIGEHKIHGADKVAGFLDENPEVLKDLERQIVARGEDLFMLDDSKVSAEGALG